MSAQFLQICPPEWISAGQRVTGRSECGSAGPTPALLQRLRAVCGDIPVWHCAVPISKVEMPLFPPHGSLLWAPTYPLDSLKVPLLQQWRRGRSQGEIRWRLRQPQNTSIDGNKEKLQHMLLCLYKQDDTNSWLVVMSLTSNGLLLCLCCLVCGA